jgi:hypothetical protein
VLGKSTGLLEANTKIYNKYKERKNKREKEVTVQPELCEEIVSSRDIVFPCKHQETVISSAGINLTLGYNRNREVLN